jgi:lysyl-tRNA synthetase class I
MSNPHSDNYPYHGDTFTVVCPKCAKTNRVEVTQQDGHNEPEEYSCANCHHILGTTRASLTPRTSIID